MSGPSVSLEEEASAILSEAGRAPAHIPSLRFERTTPPPVDARCAAIDGGSTVVLDAKTLGLYCVRAGYSLREPGDRFVDAFTSRRARAVTRRGHARTWDQILRTYAWTGEPPTMNFDLSRLVPQLAEAERVLAEEVAALRALERLGPGDVLLLDGSHDEDERTRPMREGLLHEARRRDVCVVAVAKDSSLSIGGVLPFPLELEEMAARSGTRAPWSCDVTDALGSPVPGNRILGVRWDERSPVFRVDIPPTAGEDIVSRLGLLCNDAACPGYPYPLARIHRRVHYEAAEVEGLRRDLEGLISRRRGTLLSMRLFGRGRDVLALVD